MGLSARDRDSPQHRQKVDIISRKQVCFFVLSFERSVHIKGGGGCKGEQEMVAPLHAHAQTVSPIHIAPTNPDVS